VILLARHNQVVSDRFVRPDPAAPPGDADHGVVVADCPFLGHLISSKSATSSGEPFVMISTASIMILDDCINCGDGDGHNGIRGFYG
jgi:hypothetical protein